MTRRLYETTEDYHARLARSLTDTGVASPELREAIAQAACEAGHHAWPTTDGYNDRAEKRAWLVIADAVLAVLMTAQDEETVILAMARAHDREDAAQKGEPSPWDHGAAEDALFVSERTAAMREAFNAARMALAPPLSKPENRKA